MKIAYVVKDYTNSSGMERILFCKADYFVSQGHEVCIISDKPSRPEPFFSFDPRIKMIHLKTSSDKKYKKEYLKELSDCLNQIKPDISISTGLGNGLYLYEVDDKSKKILEFHFAKYRRKHWLTKIDGSAIGMFFANLFVGDKVRVAKKYDKLIILTEEDKESWRGLSNVEVISNPLFAMPTEYSDTSSKRVIFVGQIVYQKGYDYLIDVWQMVAKRHPDWKLVAFGQGRRKKEVEELIKQKGLQEVVEIMAPVKDIYKEMVKSSIYVMTSRHEGQGLSLIESMACGLPAVSFACKCGPREIISNGEDGFLVDFADVKNCADKICTLIENPEVRKEMGEAARRNMLRYAPDKILPQWIKLFEGLVIQKK